jgi:competence protein ComEC
MLKKSKIYLIILVLLCSIYPAAKVFTPESGENIIPHTAQTAEQNPEAQPGSVSAKTDYKNMTVHFLDVGQADSIFVDFGSYEILVDGGNNADGPFVSDYLKPYIDGNLELIVATHAHEDHIGGLDDVISAYQVGRIIYSDEISTTATFMDFYDAAVSEPDCVFIGDSDITFDLGYGAKFIILETGDGYREPNNNSVVSLIDYNEIEILLAGDMETSVEKSNLSKFSDIDVLKVGHHGSRTASSQDFLDVVKPEVSIISAGLDNNYKLPNEDVINRLLSMNSAVYGTFRSGTIIMTTDGVQYHFNTEIQLTPDDAGAPSTSGDGA